MPGVPTSRGCDACRKQKKKCDQLKPACTRCSRLQIPCIGSGQKRYKFKQGFAAATFSNTTATATRVQNNAIILSSITQIPPNETTTITTEFLEVLQVTDVRYDVTWYGPFLETLPNRIGSSPALDAAIGAFTYAVTALRTRQHSPGMISRYVKGLTALRTCLDDPIQTKSVHTVCAIYLLMVSQSWVGRPEDQFANHSQMLAQILNASVAQGWEGQFEDGMILTLSMPVVFQSVINPEIPLGPWFWTLVKTYEPKKPVLSNQGKRIPSIDFYLLAQITQWIREPLLHVGDITAAYQQLLTDCLTVRSVLDVIAERIASGLPIPLTRLHTRPQAAYSMLLCLGLVLNQILRIVEPDNCSLAEETESLVNETFWLSKIVDEYRPLGACFMPVSLSMAWATTEDAAMRDLVGDILVGYESDFTATKWIETCHWMKKRFDDVKANLDVAFMPR